MFSNSVSKGCSIFMNTLSHVFINVPMHDQAVPMTACRFNLQYLKYFQRSSHRATTNKLNLTIFLKNSLGSLRYANEGPATLHDANRCLEINYYIVPNLCCLFCFSDSSSGETLRCCSRYVSIFHFRLMRFRHFFILTTLYDYYDVYYLKMV